MRFLLHYKPKVDDFHESPALEIINTVIQKGGIVSYNDPHIPEVKTNQGNKLTSVELKEQDIKLADCVILTTKHDAFNVDFIQQHARLIVDLRNMIEDGNEQVYKL